MPESKPKRPTPRKCPPELRERAVCRVREAHQFADACGLGGEAVAK